MTLSLPGKRINRVNIVEICLYNTKSETPSSSPFHDRVLTGPTLRTSIAMTLRGQLPNQCWDSQC